MTTTAVSIMNKGQRKLFEDIERTAWLSSCGRYRHALGRHWDQGLGYALFIGLNPSTADGQSDDPTIRRCMRFARDWGFGGLEMCNLFDWRATDPKRLPRKQIAVSDKNDPAMGCRAMKAGIVIACWGHVPWARKRIDEVQTERFAAFQRETGNRVHCLGLTKSGFPRHPLFVRADTKPVLFW
ncbi:MAG: DUF1643 domain-containing protein [Phycisphaerales bacterium]|nr:DUF1643 domain-containing protein [Phycisphaerales bacterium]